MRIKLKAFYKSRKFKLILLVTLLSLAVMGFLSYWASRAPSINIDTIDELRSINTDDKILIVAPHTDDETLGAGGIIMRAAQKKIPTKIVLITNGDNNIFSTDLEYKTLRPNNKKFIEAGEARQQETLGAMSTLGLTKDDVIFLGYPDGGIKALYLTNWPTHNPYKSPATGGTNSPYKLNYEPNVLYAGENLLKNMTQIISDFKPTIIITPHPNDSHPDHSFAYEFVKKGLENIYGPNSTDKPMVLAYLIHHKVFPHPGGYKPNEYLRPPFTASLDMHWYKVSLTQEETNKKYDAVRDYKTQLKIPELGTLMKGFVRRNELFEQLL